MLRILTVTTDAMTNQNILTIYVTLYVTLTLTEAVTYEYHRSTRANGDPSYIG